jgi:hypothetical protein
MTDTTAPPNAEESLSTGLVNYRFARVEVLVAEAEGSFEDLRTTADRPVTSTSQDSESPGSSPKTVATDCGTVVFSESEPGDALNALDSKAFGIRSPDLHRRAQGHKYGLSSGRMIDLNLKYIRSMGLLVGL